MKSLICLLLLTAVTVSSAQPDYKLPALPGPPPGLFPAGGSGPPPGFGGPVHDVIHQPGYGAPKEAQSPYGGPGEGPIHGGPPPGGERPYGGERAYGGGGGGQCDCLRWTNYINADTPGDTGDFETLGAPDEKGRPGTIHHVRPDVCTIPVRMECRTVYDKVAWYLPYEKITHPCNPMGKGFACENKKQKNGKCRDYEVRLLCFYADKGDYSCPCLSWSQWYDNDDPNDKGDEELIGRKLPRYVCAGGYQPVDVQCMTATGLDVFHAGNKKVQCDLQGLSCYNEDQGRNCKCHDYKVRFLCPKFPATYPMANYGEQGKNATYNGEYAGGSGDERHDDSNRHGGGGYNGGGPFGSYPGEDEGYDGGSRGGGGGGYDGGSRGGGYDGGSRGGGGYDGGSRGGDGGGYDGGSRGGGGYDGGSRGGDGGSRGGGGYDGGSRGGDGGSRGGGGYDGGSRGGGGGGYDGGSRGGSGYDGGSRFGPGGDYGGGLHNGSKLCAGGGPCNSSHPGGPGGYGNKSDSFPGIAPLPFGIDERIKAGFGRPGGGGGYGGHHNDSHGGHGGEGGGGQRGGGGYGEHHNDSHGGHGGEGGGGHRGGGGPPESGYNKREEPLDGTYTYNEKILAAAMTIESNNDKFDLSAGDAYEPGDNIHHDDNPKN